jgi:hypothetical protein
LDINATSSPIAIDTTSSVVQSTLNSPVFDEASSWETDSNVYTDITVSEDGDPDSRVDIEYPEVDFPSIPPTNGLASSNTHVSYGPLSLEAHYISVGVPASVAAWFSEEPVYPFLKAVSREDFLLLQTS